MPGFISTREITAENLVKRYGTFAAVDGVSFQVAAGEIYGFLGPNGAGKSTTVSMLTTLSLPTSGAIRVGGFDAVTQADAVRRIAGVALQEIGLDPLMKSTEMLTLQARLFGLTARTAKARAYELLELVGLADVTDRPVGKYSGGMRRRLDLAMALVHQPEVLFLDEPTTGLDPASRRDIWAEVRRLNRDQGMTIFLTTQYLEEADELADRIAIIARGKIRVEGPPEALKADLGGESINITFREDADVEAARGLVGALADGMQVDRRTLRLYRKDAAAIVPVVVGRLNEGGLQPVALTLTQPTLDDVFLKVTGQNFDGDAETAQPAQPAKPRKAS
jgi:ABC-2 type transport system ATP-binding protein